MANNGQVCKKFFPQLYAPHTYYSANELRYVTDVSLKNIDVCDTLSIMHRLSLFGMRTVCNHAWIRKIFH